MCFVIGFISIRKYYPSVIYPQKNGFAEDKNVSTVFIENVGYYSSKEIKLSNKEISYFKITQPKFILNEEHTIKKKCLS